MILLSPPQLNPSIIWTAVELSFLEENKNAKHSSILSLYKTSHLTVNQEIIHQLFARQHAKHKQPAFYANSNIVYPASLSLEQASSEQTARFKASLFRGETFIDLSGGMGMDSYFLAQCFKSGILVERNEELAKITSHNFALLNQLNMLFAIGMEAEEFVKGYDGHCDLIYLDPARRNERGAKVVKLSDCEPNIIHLLPQLFNLSDTVLLKTSPLLDIYAACHELKNVKNVYVVAVENECKELLFHLEKNYHDDYKIHTINLVNEKEVSFSFSVTEEEKATAFVGKIERYLYEPNTAILKSGCFKLIGKSFGLTKLHTNSHLYSSDKLINDFPGRVFEIVAQTKVDKKQISELIPEKKANVSMRNFPGTVDALKKKLGLMDGGNIYVFATTDFLNNKIILITRKAVYH